MSLRIGVVGTGYVGIVSGTTFAETGNKVLCVDIDEAKVEKMKRGKSPIYEPGLELLLERNLEVGRLDFTTELSKAVSVSNIVFLCLPTPPNEDGSADLQHVMKVAGDIADILFKTNGFNDYTSFEKPLIVVNKSTVPVGTGSKVQSIFDDKLGQGKVTVVSNPEFLREGFAIEDAMKPERVVIGTENEYAAETMRSLYKPFVRSGAPIHVFDVKSSEVTKYAANSFLATKISFMNDLSAYCESVGADIESIRMGIGSDTRIGKRFLFAGLGYGGSCFPKDVRALAFSARESGNQLQIVESAQEVNTKQIQRFANKIVDYYGGNLNGKKIALWGLAFKPNTDDVREAPAFEVIRILKNAGADIHAYDEEAIETSRNAVGHLVSYGEDAYSVLDDADALVIATEWNAFRNPDWEKMASLLKEITLFDGRNLFDLSDMEDRGYNYISIGRRAILKNSQ
ncbi:MAG: UDP-glucose/GDP-mannose dehydrogenase family protein [Candidatus Kapaibacteriales bacterium]